MVVAEVKPLFALMRSSSETEKAVAIPQRLSPTITVYALHDGAVSPEQGNVRIRSLEMIYHVALRF